MRSFKFSWWYFKDVYYYPIRQFLKNIIKFRKELSNFYDWNYDLGLFRRTIELNYIHIKEKGYEVDSSRNKKLSMMERAIYILKCFEEDNFIELAERELGKEVIHGNTWFEPCEYKPGYSTMKDDNTEEQTNSNREIFQKSIDIQNQLWMELWSIIQGQDYSKFKPNEHLGWDEQFDGSGLLGWWD